MIFHILVRSLKVFAKDRIEKGRKQKKSLWPPFFYEKLAIMLEFFWENLYTLNKEKVWMEGREIDAKKITGECRRV